MGGGSEGITVVNAPKHPEAFAFLEKRNAEKQALAKVVARENTANSDHYPFTRKGVPAFFIYTLGDVKAYHNPFDQAAALPFSRYEAVFGLIADFAAYLQGR
jgi:Zn-dependent M28 family amino/carboxypeptidase